MAIWPVLKRSMTKGIYVNKIHRVFTNQKTDLSL